MQQRASLLKRAGALIFCTVVSLVTFISIFVMANATTMHKFTSPQIKFTKSNTVVYVGDVAEYPAHKTAFALEYGKQGSKYLVISSPGGSFDAGLHLYHAVKRTKTTVICYRMCASMGAYILQAGARRIMARDAILMFHWPYLNVAGLPDRIPVPILHEVAVNFFREVDKLHADFTPKLHMKRAYFEGVLNKGDFWMTSAEALQMGFIDEVIDVKVGG